MQPINDSARGRWRFTPAEARAARSKMAGLRGAAVNRARGWPHAARNCAVARRARAEYARQRAAAAEAVRAAAAEVIETWLRIEAEAATQRLEEQRQRQAVVLRELRIALHHAIGMPLSGPRHFGPIAFPPAPKWR